MSCQRKIRHHQRLTQARTLSQRTIVPEPSSVDAALCCPTSILGALLLTRASGEVARALRPTSLAEEDVDNFAAWRAEDLGTEMDRSGRRERVAREAMVPGQAVIALKYRVRGIRGCEKAQRGL